MVREMEKMKRRKEKKRRKKREGQDEKNKFWRQFTVREKVSTVFLTNLSPIFFFDSFEKERVSRRKGRREETFFVPEITFQSLSLGYKYYKKCFKVHFLSILPFHFERKRERILFHLFTLPFFLVQNQVEEREIIESGTT